MKFPLLDHICVLPYIYTFMCVHIYICTGSYTYVCHMYFCVYTFNSSIVYMALYKFTHSLYKLE